MAFHAPDCLFAAERLPLLDRWQTSSCYGFTIHHVITASTVAALRISGQRKALTRGFGKASPEVSKCSPACLAVSAESASLAKLFLTVQHRQPFVNSTILALNHLGRFDKSGVVHHQCPVPELIDHNSNRGVPGCAVASGESGSSYRYLRSR